MSRFTTALATGHLLTKAALEECSRYGYREADIDHLLLALTIDPGIAGQILRSANIGLVETRAAVHHVRSSHVSALGMNDGLPDPGPIVFHETQGYTLTARYNELMNRASSDGNKGDAVSVLRELLSEPSGLIEEILQAAGSNTASVKAALYRVGQELSDESTPAMRARGLRRATSKIATQRGWIEMNHSVFVPAPLEGVWSLLASPLRMAEWDPRVGRVEPAESHGDTSADNPNTTSLPTFTPNGRTWAVYAPHIRPDGKPLKIKSEYQRRHVTAEVVNAPHTLVWRITYPDAQKSRPMWQECALEPAGGGTSVTITIAWQRREGWRGVVGVLLRPLSRVLVWFQLTQVGSSLSRRFA